MYAFHISLILQFYYHRFFNCIIVLLQNPYSYNFTLTAIILNVQFYHDLFVYQKMSNSYVSN